MTNIDMGNIKFAVDVIGTGNADEFAKIFGHKVATQEVFQNGCSRWSVFVPFDERKEFVKNANQSPVVIKVQEFDFACERVAPWTPVQ